MAIKQLILFCMITHAVFACTNYLVTKGASVEGHNMISYAADSHVLYGDLLHIPAADHFPGEMLDIVDWDSGKPLGKIPQIPHTYSVIGNMNEFQVAIGETTFGGLKLEDPNGIIDYGSLIWIALQRSKTAQEAIEVMTSLTQEYGYYSEGESFSIMDKTEVWILEMIGKGATEKGTVWAAQKIPDGHISSHANQARITKLDPNNQNQKFSTDAISFAKRMKFYDGPDEDFSFSDTYAPLTFSGVRGCEARVYAFFSGVLGDDTMKQYYDYILGKVTFNQYGFGTNRMPLSMPVGDKKVSLRQVMKLMRNHFEGLTIDLHDTPGAGPDKSPYRWRPMGFQVNGKSYTHERSVGTQQTAWSFVAQARENMPDIIGGVFWFGMDDTATNVYTPFYCGTTAVPHEFAVGNGDILTYSPTSMYWMTSRIAQFTYLRYQRVIVDVNKAQDELENGYITVDVPNSDKIALSIFNANGPAATKIYLANIAKQYGEKTFKRWEALDRFLLIKYMDGNVKAEENGTFKRDEYGHCKFPDQPGYDQWYFDSIVAATGDLHLELQVKPKAFNPRLTLAEEKRIDNARARKL